MHLAAQIFAKVILSGSRGRSGSPPTPRAIAIEPARGFKKFFNDVGLDSLIPQRCGLVVRTSAIWPFTRTYCEIHRSGLFLVHSAARQIQNEKRCLTRNTSPATIARDPMALKRNLIGLSLSVTCSGVLF